LSTEKHSNFLLSPDSLKLKICSKGISAT